MLGVGFIGILTAQWLSRVAFPRLKNQHKRKAIKNSAGMIGFIASYALLILGLRKNGILRPVAEKYLPQDVLTNIADIEIFILGIVVAFSVIVFELFFKKLK